MSNQWLEEEELAIVSESKNTCRKSDSIIFIKMFIILMCLFLFSPSLEASRSRHNVCMKRGEGKSFVCKTCRTYQWQDEKNADFMGRYTCAGCGEPL